VELIRTFLLVVIALTALIAPWPLLGRLIQGRRARVGTEAVAALAEIRQGPSRASLTPFLPSLPVRPEMPGLARYEALVGAAYETALTNISDALRRFAPDFDATKVKALPSIEVAMIRLRAGFLEPVNAYRPATTETVSWNFRELWTLLAAEDAALRA